MFSNRWSPLSRGRGDGDQRTPWICCLVVESPCWQHWECSQSLLVLPASQQEYPAEPSSPPHVVIFWWRESRRGALWRAVSKHSRYHRVEWSQSLTSPPGRPTPGTSSGWTGSAARIYSPSFPFHFFISRLLFNLAGRWLLELNHILLTVPIKPPVIILSSAASSHPSVEVTVSTSDWRLARLWQLSVRGRHSIPPSAHSRPGHTGNTVTYGPQE